MKYRPNTPSHDFKFFRKACCQLLDVKGAKHFGDEEDKWEAPGIDNGEEERLRYVSHNGWFILIPSCKYYIWDVGTSMIIYYVNN